MYFFQAIKDKIQGKAPKGAKRSSKWEKIRATHLERFPYCAICGRKTKVQVHHVVPFHIAPDLELEPKNLRTLCENKKHGITCHLLVGHVGNYRKANPSIDVDIATWRLKLGVFYRNSGLKDPFDWE